MIEFIKYKKIPYIISGALIVLSLISFLLFGLKWGIEFTGGSIMEIEYKENRPSVDELKNTLSNLNLEEFYIQPVGENGFMIRMPDISSKTYYEMKEVLGDNVSEKYFESIGPAVGEELKRKSVIGVSLASLAIITYIAITFKGVSKPIKSWQYGLIAFAVDLFHDVLIVLGIFSFIGHFLGVQVTIPIIVALLTILGYSINDTIVIFDRVRENLIKKSSEEFDIIVNKSLNETISRSINTSVTTLFALIPILFFGGETLRYFILALVTGVVIGTYSSIFIAGPLLTTLFNYKKNK